MALSNSPQHRHYTTLIDKFKFPDSDVDGLDRRLNVLVHGRCGERRSPKVQLSTVPGIEPETSRLAVRDLPKVPNSHTERFLPIMFPFFVSLSRVVWAMMERRDQKENLEPW